MKNENVSKLAYAVIGVIGLITGIAAAKHQEKRYREELEEFEKANKSRRDYINALGVATEQLQSEVNEMSALADEVLAYIEESEKDLDEEEEL
jgi:predicted  nucleic acid-binding Zn-ribbon protein